MFLKKIRSSKDAKEERDRGVKGEVRYSALWFALQVEVPYTEGCMQPSEAEHKQSGSLQLKGNLSPMLAWS